MICSKCGGKLGVTDPTHVVETNEILRRRRCKSCGAYIYTVESEIDYEYIRNDWNKYCRTARKNRRKSTDGKG